MKPRKLDRPTVKIVIGVTDLIGVLIYNWTHTGGLLASYVDPAFIGYIAAGGVELAIVGLSLRIGEFRISKADTRFFVVTLIAVVIVSALANVAEGYAVKFGEALTLFNIRRLDIIQAVVSLSATGLLSLVTFALAEIVGNDLTTVQASSSDVTIVTRVTNDVEQSTTDTLQLTEVTPIVSPVFDLEALLASTGLSRADGVTLVQSYGLTADSAYHHLRDRLPGGLEYSRFVELFTELIDGVPLTDVTSPKLTRRYPHRYLSSRAMSHLKLTPLPGRWHRTDWLNTCLAGRTPVPLSLRN